MTQAHPSDSRSVLVPRDELEDFAHVIGNLIGELSDPGTGALAAHYRITAMLTAAPGGEGEPVAWGYCPECGSEDVRYEEGDHKQCAACRQEWFAYIDYSDVVQKNLRRLFAAPPEPVAWRPDRARVAELLSRDLSDSYDCKRVWSAWSYGTMGEDDFEPVADRIDDIVDAILALPAAPETGWRDIAAAPKDGTLVMVGAAGCGVSIVRWMLDCWIDEQGFTQAKWPTHWMPLPDAPVAPSPKGGE